MFCVGTQSVDAKPLLEGKTPITSKWVQLENFKILLRELLKDGTVTPEEQSEIRRQIRLLEDGGLLLLLKALYSTKDVSRLWYLEIDSIFEV